MQGRIKTLDRGFFFIWTASVEYFAHKEDLPAGVTFEMLQPGMLVSFDPIPDAPRGPRATNLRIVDLG